MGFYIQGGSASQESNYGFSNFTASDGSTPDTIPPSTPTNLAANVASLSEIDLSWSASTDNVAVVGYQIFRNTTKIATTASPSFADKTVIPGVQYTYAVTAFDAAGNISAQSSPVVAETSSVPDTTPPSVPTNLQSSNVTSSSLTVTWSASTDNVGVAGYQIFRNGAEVGATSTTSYADTGLVASTTYVYTVAAYDASGNVSTQSQQLTVTTAAAALMTPSFIQVNNNEIASGTKTSVVFNASTQAGNTIVVYVIWDNAGSVALTDSNGNAFVNVGGPLSWGSGYSAQIFYATNIVGGTDTVTAAFRTSVTSFGVIYVHEYAGINTLNPVDVTASASGSSTALNSGTATTTSANDLIFGAGVSDNMVTAAGSGFISRDMAYGNITEDRIAEAIGSYAATATHNGKMWGMQMVAFRAAQ
jgi:chitodextrinase